MIASALQERRLPPDEKVATFHLPALHAEPTVFTQDQAVYQGVKVGHPFQAYKNDVFLLPNELDEKVPKLHFLGAHAQLPHLRLRSC